MHFQFMKFLTTRFERIASLLAELFLLIATYYINDFTYKQLYIAVVTITAAIDIILQYKL